MLAITARVIAPGAERRDGAWRLVKRRFIAAAGFINALVALPAGAQTSDAPPLAKLAPDSDLDAAWSRCFYQQCGAIRPLLYKRPPTY